MEAAKETVFPYCLVLLEGDAGDRIELYNLFPGCGVEETESPCLSQPVIVRNVAVGWCRICGVQMRQRFITPVNVEAQIDIRVEKVRRKKTNE